MSFTTATISQHETTISWRRQFLRDVLLGLARPQKALPCKYFYDAKGSALFDEICELDEYYLTRTELKILHDHATEIALVIGEDCDLIELGSGSGQKTKLLLSELKAPRAYLPIDISREHLERFVRELAGVFPSLRSIPVHADFTASFSLPDTGQPRARRVVYFPGSTIGNFSPRAAWSLMSQIARLVGPGGGFLVGFDLDKDESIVWPAYNDSGGKSAMFNLNLLARINRELGADFDLSAFVHRAFYRRKEERMVMSLESKKAQIVHVAGREFSLGAGERIHTEDSYKYTLEHFGRLAQQAGFELVQEWVDVQGYFCVQYLSAL
jgi:L-histidine Nalpha-methyltransferase